MKKSSKPVTDPTSLASTTSELLTVPQAAKLLALSEKTVWAWLGQRRLSFHKIGRATRIPKCEIVRVLREGHVAARVA